MAGKEGRRGGKETSSQERTAEFREEGSARNRLPENRVLSQDFQAHGGEPCLRTRKKKGGKKGEKKGRSSPSLGFKTTGKKDGGGGAWRASVRRGHFLIKKGGDGKKKSKVFYHEKSPDKGGRGTWVYI